MSKLNFKPREITHALEGKLAIAFRDGPERVGWYILDGAKRIRFKIPHIHSTWGKGTINDIVRRSRLNKSQFADLLGCPLDAAQYEQIIRKINPQIHRT